MNLSAKAQVIERDFQNARARANYAAFPEFARRYVKHNKDGVVLANTAMLELAVGEAEISAQKAQQWTFMACADDTLETIAVGPSIKADSIREAVDKLERALTKGPEEHQEYAAIALARAAMATDAPDRIQRVAHYLQNVQLPPAKLPSGYNFALIVCGLTVKGMSLEEEGKIAEAIVSYDHVSSLVQSNPTEKSEELLSWAEHALYRTSLLKLRQADPAALSLEIAQIHAYWEEALYGITSFPRADEKNWRVLVMIEQIVEDRKLIGPGNDADKRALVETIYRASQKTFQSPRVLRFLFFALVDAGQYDEAELALKAYLEMVEVNLKVKSTTADITLSHEERVRQDIESEYDITTVMLGGSLLYGKELGKPAEALNCTNSALNNISMYLQQHESVVELLSNAYKYQGIAYGLQASNTHEPEQRPALYAKAIEALEKAAQVAPDSFDTHYLLAVQLADMREVSRAVSEVKQSLSINPSHIPSWHLLALLLSSQKDFEKALNICAVGLKESEWDLAHTDGYSASQLDGEDYLALRITQAVLHDQVYGPEAALEPQESLFGLYTKVFAPEPSSVGESLYEIQNIRRRDQSDADLTSSGTVGRPRSGSILSVRSKSGAISEVGPAPNGSSTLDVPKANYASSVSSISSTGSKSRRHNHPPAAAAGQTSLIRSVLSLPPTVHRRSVKTVLRTARANKVLVTLWLLSASTFRRLDRMEDAQKAIEEAERTDASNPDVWYQLGLLYAAQEDQETASVAFTKALALAPYHASCLARVGRSYLDAGALEMAEGVLETTTKSVGWDCAEAWFYLGKVFEASDRLARAKECFWYALDLESSRPIRRFTDAVPRYLV
ncbi:hypothetical protein BGZ98_006258 [Dissophora globulifera]|nr:hypothetical protein BGZ98_006258 [Dissophora globulifera]